MLDTMSVQGSLRINRYIMECKYIMEIQKDAQYLELIDTLWNVNNNITTDITDKVIRINRYIMECK